MNFKFTNLIGAPYRGGTLLIHENELLSPAGNRVNQVHLVQSTSQTLPFENLKQVRTLAVSPNGRFLLSIDADGKALLINRLRQVLLAHFSFKGEVAAAQFSPDGRFLAAAVGRLVQVWRTPSPEKSMTPMELYRTYGQCHADVTSLDWSPDGLFIAAGSKDLTARVYSLDPIPGYEPPVLAHRNTVVGVFFTALNSQEASQVAGQEPVSLYTLARDGALLGWSFRKAESGQGGSYSEAKQAEEDQAEGPTGDEEAEQPAKKRARGAPAKRGSERGPNGPTPSLAGGTWAMTAKHKFETRGGKATACAYHAGTGVLAMGTSNGILELLQLPEATTIHTLSASRERLTSLSFNARGDWLAVGCALLGQLLVWEWRSETYVLRQQGHHHDIAAAAFSPDGAIIATGADDQKVKLYSAASGFCFATLTDHHAPITSLAFVPTGHALLSASLDGTVRAWDLIRYRSFRTLTAPDPVQFGSLAVDPGGEVVCAGTLDTFQIYVWSLRTGRLLDVLAGHEGPVSGLAFAPPAGGSAPLLASVSWDRTARTWDVWGASAGDLMEHSHDVLALAYRPDGKQLATSTLDGNINLWDPAEAVLMSTIAGRRDMRGGRLSHDRRSADNSGAGAAATSLAYAADGSWLIAGGESKWVVIYDVAEGIMLRRFQISANRSLDGVLDLLNSKQMTDAGPLNLINDEPEDEGGPELLPVSLDPATAAGVPGAPRKMPVIRTRGLALSPTGRCWAAATTEGLLLYSVDEGAAFDPTDLTEGVTKSAFTAALASGAYLRAMLLALRLGSGELLEQAIMGTPPAQIITVAGALPALFLPTLLNRLAELMSNSPHIEFLLSWITAVCTRHGRILETAAGGVSAPGSQLGAGAPTSSVLLPALRGMQKTLNRVHTEIATVTEQNMYTLDYLINVGQIGDAEGSE